MMERRMKRKFHVRCEAGENLEITSKSYLSLYWALGHLEQFPVEITRADYQTLLRVPGIGTKSARRILQARRTGSISFSSLKTMGVVLKRAIYFITCHGKSAYPFMKIDEDYITRNLLADEPDVMKGYGSHVTYKQLTFEDFLTKQ